MGQDRPGDRLQGAELTAAGDQAPQESIATCVHTVFDIGMYNGLDSAYYLELGFRVVAVEANPLFVQRARTKFEREIETGLMTVVAAAISEKPGTATLHLSGDDSGSSSLLGERVASLNPVGTIEVPGIAYGNLLERYGAPYFLKIDIEGADRFCVLALTRQTRPSFLSFEIGPDFEELFKHVVDVGFNRFKIINQTNFRSIANDNPFSDRLAYRLMLHLGYAAPSAVRRGGRFFRTGTSGPAPWLSNGQWERAEEIIARWRDYVAAGRRTAWYDLQACP